MLFGLGGLEISSGEVLITLELAYQGPVVGLRKFLIVDDHDIDLSNRLARVEEVANVECCQILHESGPRKVICRHPHAQVQTGAGNLNVRKRSDDLVVHQTDIEQEKADMVGTLIDGEAVSIRKTVEQDTRAQILVSIRLGVESGLPIDGPEDLMLEV